MSGDDTMVVQPVPVIAEIKNWPEPIKPPFVKRTTVRTYIIDPAATDTFVQICDYEPKRYRMAITPIDVAVAVTMEPPTDSPDTSAAGDAPQGLHLPVATQPYEFFGPDAFWLNCIGAIGRVTVLKEYC
jgi:hypothetical protein